jgi:hypothetical protein
MNDQIKEVAARVAQEVMESAGSPFDWWEEFLTRCLAELGKDVEPVAWMICYQGQMPYFVYDEHEIPNDEFVAVEPLYTRPQTIEAEAEIVYFYRMEDGRSDVWTNTTERYYNWIVEDPNYRTMKLHAAPSQATKAAPAANEIERLRAELDTALAELKTIQIEYGDLYESYQYYKNQLATGAIEPEPFGYFRAEPFGWVDCAETDEGAIALYEHPPIRSRKS